MDSLSLAVGPVASAKRDIETMRTRGALEIGKHAALALARAAQAYPGSSLVGLHAELLEAAKTLAAARPTAVTLRNALNVVLSALDGPTSLTAAKAAVLRRAHVYAKEQEAARDAIARLGARLLARDRVVLTHCHSTVANAALAAASRKNRGLRVYATETRPFRQGLVTARNLAQAGVDTTLIVDSAVAHTIQTEDVTKVVIGADTVAADGTVYNKIGTLQLCLVAKALRVPVLVCAETAKLSPYTRRGDPVPIEERDEHEVADPAQVPGVHIHNPVFDATPPRLISKIVTEAGVVRPSQVRRLLDRRFKDVTLWL